jgi:hypothetical protein
MERSVVPLAQSLDTYPSSIHYHHGNASHEAPQDVVGGSLVADPLADGNPTEECNGYVRERRARWQNDENSRPISKLNDIAGSLGAEYPSNE